MAESGSKWWHRSLNPFVGCTKVSEGCRLCWAEQVAKTRLRHLPSYQGVVDDRGWTGEVRGVQGGLRRVESVRKGIVFLCDMGDLFHGGFDEVSVGFRSVVIAVLAGARKGSTARFCLLTKRAAMMARVVQGFVEQERQETTLDDRRRALRERIWIGVSAEHSAALAERAPYLYGLPCAGTFISAEPLLGSLRRGGDATLRGVIMGAPTPSACTCGAWHGYTRCPYRGGVARDAPTAVTRCQGFVRERGAGIDWVIAGAETGGGAVHPDIEWFGEIVKDCVDTGTPLYVKQLGAHPYARRGADERHADIGAGGRGTDMGKWPEELRVRQWPLRLILEAKRW